MIPVFQSLRLVACSLLLSLAITHPANALASESTASAKHRSIPLDCGGWFSGFAMHSSGRLYGFGDVFGMWRSDDSGLSWNYLQGDFTTDEQFVNGCAVSIGDADTVSFIGNGSVFLSTDGGTSWKVIMDFIDSRRDRGATPLIFHPRRDSEIWVATARGDQIGTLWRTLDKGATWRKMGGDIFDYVTATGVYIHPNFPNQVWVGAVGGLYVSADLGATFTRVWSNVGGDAPFVGTEPTVGAMARRADGIGYIATNTKGWRISATNYADPATYKAEPTVSWWSGWGPANATVLADGSFLTNGPREPDRPDDDPESLMRSTDGGLTWNPLPMRLLTPPTPSWHKPARPGQRADGGRDMIVQDPANPNRWHITGGGAPAISEDAGKTWRFPPNANGLAGVPTFKTRFVRDNPLVALIPGSDHGGFIVTDGGLSGEVFASIRTSIDRLQTHHQIMANHDGTVLIAAGVDQTIATLILRSTDGGATWTEKPNAGNGLPPSSEGITRAIASPDNIDDFLVLLGSGGTHSNPGLYRTKDGGRTFRKSESIPDNFDTGARYHPENAWLETDGILRDTRYLALRSNRDNPTNHVWRSTDGGDTWAVTRAEPFPGEWIACLAVDPATASRLWVSSSRGLVRSGDGGDSWVKVGNFKSVKRVDAARGNVAVFGRLPDDTWDKIYYSPDDGTTWIEQTGPGHRYANLSDLAINPHNPSEIWVSGMSINIITSSTTPAPAAPKASPALAVALLTLPTDDPFGSDEALAAEEAPTHELFPEEPTVTLAAIKTAPAANAVDDVFPDDTTPPLEKLVGTTPQTSDDDIFPSDRPAEPAAALAPRLAVAVADTTSDPFPEDAAATPAASAGINPLVLTTTEDTVFAATDSDPFSADAVDAERAAALASRSAAVATETPDDLFPEGAVAARVAPAGINPFFVGPAEDTVFAPTESDPFSTEAVAAERAAALASRSAAVATDTPDDLFPEGAVAAPVAPAGVNPLFSGAAEGTVFAPAEIDAVSADAVAAAPAPQPAPTGSRFFTPTEDDVFVAEATPPSETPNPPPATATTQDAPVLASASAPPAPSEISPAPAVVFPFPPAPPSPAAATPAKTITPIAPPKESDEIFRPVLRGPKNRTSTTQSTDK